MKYCKQRFMKFLDYPDEWESLYTDELFQIQLNEMLQNDLGEEETKIQFQEGKYGGGSEHYRLGAVLWVLKNLDKSKYDKLKLAILKYTYICSTSGINPLLAAFEWNVNGDEFL